jgi:hypothetical protein
MEAQALHHWGYSAGVGTDYYPLSRNAANEKVHAASANAFSALARYLLSEGSAASY